MNKVKCLVCGEQIKITNDNISNCPCCNSSIAYELSLENDRTKQLKHEALIYIINKEYKKLLLFIDNNYNNLLLEYYRMFSFLSLDKEYNKDLFYSLKLEYTDEELDTIILHMLENKQLFSDDEILLLVNKTKNNEKFLDILNSNRTSDYEKTKEKDLREKLFSKTIVPIIKEKNKTKEENITLTILGIGIYILSFLIVLIFTKNELKYSFFNLLTIIPCIILCNSLPKLFLKDNRVLIKVALFVLLLFVLTIPSLLFTNDYNILNHIIGVLKSPLEFFETLIEGMNPYEE